MSDNERDTLLELEGIASQATNQPYPIPTSLWGKQIAMAVYAAGYRKPRTVTEYGIVFNRNACGLIPPALSLEEFKERYPHETGWSITDRDTYLQRTRQEVDPEPGEWELMPSEPAQ